MNRYGTLLLTAGPSGTGKTTVRNALVQRQPDLHFSVSCTTRTPREGEQDGGDYTFVDTATFLKRAENGGFLEFAEVHGNYYGTLRSEVESHVHKGQSVLLDIDVQGMRQIVRNIRDTWLNPMLTTVFIAPPSLQEMEARLRRRGTENEEIIRTRLSNAIHELQAWREFQYLVINTTVDQAVDELCAIIVACNARTPLMRDMHPWQTS